MKTSKHHTSLQVSLTLAAAAFLFLSADSANALIVPLDPGPVGTTYTNVDFSLTALNGTVASGQTISVDVIFPSGIDAVYRYDGIGAQQLYGWHLGLNFSGGTVTTQPFVSGVYALDSSNPIGASFGTITLYNGTFSGYNANHNSTNSLAALLAFEDVQYHGVRMDLHFPAYAESNVTVTSGNFGFRRNGSGEFTEIVQAVPEPSVSVFIALALTTFGVSRKRKPASA